MRIGSNVYQLQWLASIRNQQREIASTQQQLSTGKRIITAADDPAGAAQSILLQQGLDRLQNFNANAETARRRLGLEESSLAQANDALNRVRELAIQAANGAQTQESRGAIAAEARELLSSLLTTANSQDGEGRYLFAGNLVQSRPFILSGSVQYAGDTGIRSQRVADARTVQENDAGSAVFMQIPAGNGTYSITANPGNQGTVSWSSATVASGTPFIPDTYTLAFTAAATWEARNSAGAVVSTGTYAPGESISFQGATVEFQGTPATGDRFTVNSAGFKDVFRTVQDFITT
ncbi:MAG: flagellar hook-associated protein FlgL, partial [Gammaproteobacteria bacterium]|nr:flagellar hook-associated protein FlgL [Gammaproteobacteria bacterium]